MLISIVKVPSKKNPKIVAINPLNINANRQNINNGGQALNISK